MNFKKGFTLIELLVVIAIIGILSGIVLTSLGSARDKAKDASAKASMASMRAQAELGVDNSGNYLNDICNATTGNGEIGTLITAVESAVGDTAATTCYDNDTDDAVATIVPTEWAVETTLIAPEFYCVDSRGTAKGYTADPTVTSAGCP
ncbi:MAG: type II secretion system protein [Candidatus Vogelbacteria bacterium]|nr:type II secretion system protein [Candidatus Vogelbacteria bacterium]